MHTNTIEEFEALDIQALIDQEKSKMAFMREHPTTFNASRISRFILLVFGDLKTYKYTVKSIVLESETAHIQQRKANILKSLVTQ